MITYNTCIMKYFAYGMNTNLGQMANRCPQARSLGASELPGYEFRFSTHADVIPNPDYCTYGVLWEITDSCLASLDQLEGYPYYYDREWVTVIHNGEPVKALVYYMVGDPKDSPAHQSYLDMLYQGYRAHGVDTAQIQDAQRLAENFQTILDRRGYYFYDNIYEY